MLTVLKNQYSEELKRIGNIVLNCHFWDCECQDHYIHPLTEIVCTVCGCEQEEMPPSRENEVTEFREAWHLHGVGV